MSNPNLMNPLNNGIAINEEIASGNKENQPGVFADLAPSHSKDVYEKAWMSFIMFANPDGEPTELDFAGYFQHLEMQTHFGWKQPTTALKYIDGTLDRSKTMARKQQPLANRARSMICRYCLKLKVGLRL